MKRWQWTIGGLVGATTLGLVSASGAGAQELGAEARREPGRRFEAAAEYLQLTPEQRAAWQEALEAHRAETEPLREEGSALRERLRAELESDNADPTQVGEAALALKQHRESQKASRERLEAQLKALLSPEQQTRFEAFKAARQLQREGRRQQRQQRPGARPPSEG